MDRVCSGTHYIAVFASNYKLKLMIARKLQLSIANFEKQVSLDANNHIKFLSAVLNYWESRC